MSYTLRGRLESRLAGALVPAVAAAILALAIHRWWPVEIAATMIGVGLVLDLAYDRLLDYQPGWLALPLGALELGVVTGIAYLLELRAPLGPAIAFFCGAWVVAQLLGHAVYPVLRLSYGDDGGELGRGGLVAAGALGALFLAAAATAWVSAPPTVYLARGVHQGPLILDREQTLVGRDGAIVRGGIVVRADGVTVRNVTVVGGENGIDVDGARRVRLDRVHVLNARVDGIHVRLSEVAITNCTVALGPRPYTQGIDISFTMHLPMSMVRGCEIVGGAEGIVTHSAMVMVERNRVHDTLLRGITMTEMSMGHVSRNQVTNALGVGIFCGDRSECAIDRNVVAGTREDAGSDLSRVGVGIEADFDSIAQLEDNVLAANPVPQRAFAGARFGELP